MKKTKAIQTKAKDKDKAKTMTRQDRTRHDTTRQDKTMTFGKTVENNARKALRFFGCGGVELRWRKWGEGRPDPYPNPDSFGSHGPGVLS
jgi:hypothetical protein